MKKNQVHTIWYVLIVVLVIAVAIAGWMFYSSQAAFINYYRCPQWKCLYNQTYVCPAGTTWRSCINGVLDCTTPNGNKSYACPAGYSPRCWSDWTLVCISNSFNYICDYDMPPSPTFLNCTRFGSCNYCPV